MSKLFLRSMALTAGLLFLLNLLTVNVRGLAQEETLPAPADSENATEQHEVLTRGPVHEAFAEQINNDPESGALVPKAPPEPIGEVPPEFKPEGDNVIWIPGYWSWDDEREDHVWVSGVWRVPPQDRRWVPGYWHNTDEGYHWISGFWISTSQTSVQYQQTPPSSLETGPTSVAPDTNHFWVPGVWRYGTTYRWRPGYWRPFRADCIWIPAHYIWTPRGTVFVDGYWDYRMPRRGQLFAPVYIRHHRYRHVRYRYRPSCVINLGSIGMHLFVRPSYHHYYFGDYYGTTYSSRNFYASFRFQSSGFGCDPFLTYYQWHFGRQGINYRQRLHQSHSYFVRNQRQRPARTLRSQTNVIVKQQNITNIQNNTNINVNVLGRSLRDVARDTRPSQKLVRLANEQRTVHQEDLQKLREISVKRRDHERGPKGPPANKLARQDGPAKKTVAQAVRTAAQTELALPPTRPMRQSVEERVSSRTEELRRKLAEQKAAAKGPTGKATPARPTPQKVAPGKITRPAVTAGKADKIVGPLPETTATTSEKKTAAATRAEELRQKLAEKKSAARPPTEKATPARPTPEKVAPGKITRPAVTAGKADKIVGPLPETTAATPEKKATAATRVEELRRKLAEKNAAITPPAVKITPARPTPQKVAPGKITRPAVTASQPPKVASPQPVPTTRPATTRPTSRGEELRRKLAEKKAAITPPAVKITPARPTPQKVAPGKITRPAVTASQPPKVASPQPVPTTRPATTRPTSRGEELRRKLAEKKAAITPPAVKITPARPTPQKVAPSKTTRPAVTTSRGRSSSIVGPQPARTATPSRARPLTTSPKSTVPRPTIKSRNSSTPNPSRTQSATTPNRGTSSTSRPLPSRTPTRTAPATKGRTPAPASSRSSSIPGRSSSMTRPTPARPSTSSTRRSLPTTTRSAAPRSAPVRKSTSPARTLPTPSSRKATSRPSSSRTVSPRPSSSSRTVGPRPSSSSRTVTPRATSGRSPSARSRGGSTGATRRPTARTSPGSRKK